MIAVRTRGVAPTPKTARNNGMNTPDAETFTYTRRWLAEHAEAVQLAAVPSAHLQKVEADTVMPV